MFRFLEATCQYVIAALAAITCAFMLSGFEFWLLPPGDEGFVGMGIGMLMILIPSLIVLLIGALIWTGQRRVKTMSRTALWKQSAAQILVIPVAYGYMILSLRSMLLPVRVAGGVFACAAIVETWVHTRMGIEVV